VYLASRQILHGLKAVQDDACLVRRNFQTEPLPQWGETGDL